MTRWSASITVPLKNRQALSCSQTSARVPAPSCASPGNVTSSMATKSQSAEPGLKYRFPSIALPSPYVGRGHRARDLSDPIAGHAAVTLLGELAFGDEQREGATEVDLGARLRHHVTLAEARLQGLCRDEGGVLLLGDLVGRSSAAATTGSSS